MRGVREGSKGEPGAASGHCGAGPRAFMLFAGGPRPVYKQIAGTNARHRQRQQHIVPDEAQGRTSRTRATAEAPAPPRRASGASVLAACLRACRGSIPPALSVGVGVFGMSQPV